MAIRYASPESTPIVAATPEQLDWLRLSSISGIGPARQRSLLAAFGLPAQIFAASQASIASVIGSDAARALLAPVEAGWLEAASNWLEAADHHLITLADPHYPATLLEITDPPVLLYLKGRLELLQRPAFAIIGARSASVQGEANAEAFARHLARHGLSIVSGLAAGIDAAAHTGALAVSEGENENAGSTIAVIGTGIDRIYPARNAGLARRIAAHGAIVSEFALGTPPLSQNFPRRNRLIAGLSQGVLVVEAALNSGSLITARLASEQGREVFAIPGSIHSPLVRGCHRLIRDGAKLVETAEDIIEELRGRMGKELPEALRNPPAPRQLGIKQPIGPQRQLELATLSPESRAVLDVLGHDSLDLDSLATHCNLTVEALYAILLPLELDGLLVRLPGGRVQRR